MSPGRVITLAIETSNPTAPPGAGVALGESGRGPPRVLGVELLREPDRHDDDLAPAIDRLARRVGIVPGDLARVAVSVGPGGYTAIRTAVATAKMIAEATGARCVGVPSAAVAARRVDVSGPFAVCLASKDDTTFATVFAPGARRHDEGRLIRGEDLSSLQVRALVADSYLPSPIRHAAESLGLAIVTPVLDPAACFEVSFDRPETDPSGVLPLYPREPDAVTLWRRRTGRT